MNQESWQAIKDLFGRVNELPEEQRDSFLENHARSFPNDGPEIVREVRRLLATDARAMDFLEPPTSSALEEPLRLLSFDFRGYRLGEFELVREIGRGSTGSVYLGRQARLDRPVAIKILAPHLCMSPEHRARFQREALAASKVRHPNVVSVLSYGEQDGAHYLVMEFVPGRSLYDELQHARALHAASAEPGSRVAGSMVAESMVAASILVDSRHAGSTSTDSRQAVSPPLGATETARNRLESDSAAASTAARASPIQVSRPHLDVHDPYVAARLFEALAAGLEACHRAGVTHRDIKPQNILIDEHGEPRLVDFGLALDETVESMTRTGSLSGTPYYMSPEQARAEGREIDGRTDIYSMGAVLYELLTLDRPFEGAHAPDVFHGILNDRAVPVHHRNPNVPRSLSAICMKALRKDPRQRYASAREFGLELREFLAGRVVVANLRWVIEDRATAIVRRNPWLPATVSVAAVAVLIALAPSARPKTDDPTSGPELTIHDSARDGLIGTPTAAEKSAAHQLVIREQIESLPHDPSSTEVTDWSDVEPSEAKSPPKPRSGATDSTAPK